VVFLHGSALRSLFVVVYRPDSVAASTTFFDEFADLLDHITTYLSVVIMGDINLHLDVSTDASTSSFSSLLAANNLVQVVQSPKHTAGHLLDVVIIGSDTTVTFINVPPPVLSDQLHDRRHARSALRESPQFYTVGKKLHPFIFSITLSNHVLF